MCFSGKIFPQEMLLGGKVTKKLWLFPEEVLSDNLVKLKASVCYL